MNKILLFLCLSFLSVAQAATVIVSPTAFTGSPSRQPVLITNVLQTPLLGSSGVYSVDFVCDNSPTNIYQGQSNCAVFVLPAGRYRCDIGAFSGFRGQLFNVPDNTNTYWLSELATNGYKTATVNSAWYNRDNLLAGTNTTLRTNGAKVYIDTKGGALPPYVLTNGWAGGTVFLRSQLNLDPNTGLTWGNAEGALDYDGSVTASRVKTPLLQVESQSGRFDVQMSSGSVDFTAVSEGVDQYSFDRAVTAPALYVFGAPTLNKFILTNAATGAGVTLYITNGLVMKVQ